MKLVILVLVLLLSACTGKPYLFEVGVGATYGEGEMGHQHIDYRGYPSGGYDERRSWNANTNFKFRFKE